VFKPFAPALINLFSFLAGWSISGVAAPIGAVINDVALTMSPVNIQ